MNIQEFTIQDNSGCFWIFKGDAQEIINFISIYKGLDLASDLILMPFITDAYPVKNI